MGNLIYSNWSKTCKRFAAKAALVNGNESVSFDNIQNRISSLESSYTHMLSSLKGHVIMFSFPNSPEWLTLFLFCQKHGAIALPIDTDLPAAARERIVNSIRPVLDITSDGFKPFENPKRYQPAALIKLTSGSQGAPVPYIFTDKQALADAHNVCATMGIKGMDHNYGLIPFAHSYGLGNLVLPLILKGIPVVIATAYFPHAIAKDIAQHCPTIFPTVPSIIRTLLEADIPAQSLKSLRLIISAGSRLDSELAKRFQKSFKLIIHNFYGSSETGGIAYDKTGRCGLTGNGLGTPLKNVSIDITNTGAIRVKSDAVYTRYNKKRENGLGVHTMSDRGCIDHSGLLHLQSRTGNLVKIAGRRVDLREIESILLNLPDVSNAFVSTINTESEPKLVSVVETTCKKTCLSKQVRQFLPKWKCPHYWIPLTSFPLTSRGKPDRQKLLKIINKSQSK